MKLKRTAALIITLALVILSVPMSVFALSDVDFTLNIDPDITQYISGDVVDVPIIIKTQTDNGYVAMELILTYDKDALSLNTQLKAENDNGFTTVESDDGVHITYDSPDGRKAAIGDIVVPLKFSVLTGAAGGDYKLQLKVEMCQRLDENGSRDNKITISEAKTKTITIVETTDSEGGNSSDIDVYQGSTVATMPIIEGENTSGGGCSSCSAGGVIGVIFGFLAFFAGGVITGYILCQRRISQNDFDDEDDREAFRRDLPGRFSRAAANEDTGRRSRSFEKDGDSGRRSRSGGFESGGYESNGFENDFGGAAKSENIYEEMATRGGARMVSQQDDFDDDIDSSYFGRASESRGAAGGMSVPNDPISIGDDDDDDTFPDSLRPRNYGAQSYQAPTPEDDDDYGDDYGDYNALGSKRRDRGDDGYGSFGDPSDYGRRYRQ